MKSTGSRYTVSLTDGTILHCTIKGKFRTRGIRATNPVAAGDHVTVVRTDSGKTGVITAIKERSNYVIRRASNLSREYQILAANVDIAWLMISLVLPRTLTAFIDRFLVSAEAYRLPVIILVNKIDLLGGEEMKEKEELVEIYQKAGYRCMQLSLETGMGLEGVREEMRGKVNVVAGNSGVGKSTLIKMLDPSVNLKIGEISDANRAGRHTTTFSEMFEIDGGIRIIDTPGIRGFGTIDIDRSELFHFFPEIFRASSSCRYHNCMHINEPGCNVKQSVAEGTISESRYLNYLMMMEGEEGKYR